MKKLFNLVGNLGEIAQKPRAENLKTAVYFSETFGLFIPNSTQNWTVFKCYLLNKHPPIRLNEKTVQFSGEFGRNSPKIKSGKFENSFVFSEAFGLFLPKSPQTSTVFMQS